MNYKWISIILSVILLIAAGFWGVTIIRSHNDAKTNEELTTLQTTFIQQYGGKAVIRQLVSPSKVYAALWTDGDSINHVSWNVGGVWVVVWTAPPSTPAP